ncbi:alpha-amylase family glycosyl hydrolase [Roseivirga sp. BDSF3-8]|uniref:alpha-amylase family glycosyl hydrolase n=1 Tax=Roseivirga sp. BDSF3-8 TaxID=3241598 RepID=UPI0035327B49
MIRNSTLLFFLMLVVCGNVLGQAFTTTPSFPSPDQPITITLDLNQAQDDRAEALLDLSQKGELFLWSGVGNEDPFEYTPEEQTDFGAALPEPFEFTPLGDDVWSITINDITSFYGVPNGTEITRMGFLAKNTAGNAQTEDFVIEFVQGFALRVNEPASDNVFVTPGGNLNISAETNQTATFTATFEGNPVDTYTGTELDFTFSPPSSGTMEITAVSGTSESLNASFNIVLSTPTQVQSLPAGAVPGINYNQADDTEATLVLQAPLKNSVYVVGEFTGWDILPEYQMYRDGEYFWTTITGLTPGQEYAFYYLVDQNIRVADPFSAKILDPFNDPYIPASVYPDLKPYPAEAPAAGDDRLSVLQTAQVPYSWEINDFQRPPQEELIVYELLIRDFFGDNFGDGSQSYSNLIDTLGYLERLGVNTIELMPIMEFNGNNSWGYNPAFMFAADKFYGPADSLRHFIDEAHKRGMAVILDMVLNQNDYPSPLVKMYWEDGQPSNESPWFNRTATHPFNVFFDFNHESPYTEEFVDSVNRYWLESFRFDGFRFDLSKGFTQTDYGTDVGAWSSRDEGRIAILKRMADQIWAYDPDAYVILEHFADNTEERELANYGMMLWGNMHFDFVPALNDPSSTNSIQGLYARNRGWNDNHLVGYIESHDEERIMYEMLTYGGSEGDYDVTDLSTALNRVKMAAAFHLLTPGPKMIWEFGEMGFDTSIQKCPDGSLSSNCRIDRKKPRWDYLNDPERAKVFEVYRSILDLKTENGAVASGTFDWKPSQETKWLSYTGSEGTLIVLGNLGLTEDELRVPFPAIGTYYDYFTDGELQVTSTGYTFTLAPGEFHILSDQDLSPTASDLVPFELGEVTGLGDNSARRAGIVSYPNPVEGRLFMEWPVNQKVETIIIRDIMGRPVATYTPSGNNSLQVNTSTLPEGTYFIQYYTENTVLLDRFLKK